MTITLLKQSLGTDGQSLTDESSGLDGLKNVLQAMARALGITLKGAQAVVATATLDSWIVDAAGDYQASLRTEIGTTGTSNDTDVELQVNGSLVGDQATTDNTDADGTKQAVLVSLTSLSAGDVVDLVVSAAPGSGANLKASARITSLAVE